MNERGNIMETPLKMKGCAFDLDGVITDTAKYHFAAWRQLAKKELNLTLPDKFEIELKGVSRIDSLKKILKYGKLLDKYSEAQIQELATEKNNYYLKAIQKLSTKDILPQIPELLKQLKAHDIKISLASASKNAPMILKRLGLFEEFDAIADPTKVSHGKPAPDIYDEAAKVIDLGPNQCVGVEDSAAGVQAIKDSGMVAVAVGDPTELAKADMIVRTTDDFSYDLFEDTYEKVYD